MPLSAQVSPYARYEARPGGTWEYDVLDYNGVSLYERGGLFFAIIEQNDAALLKQYLAKYPLRNWQVFTTQDDPYVKAAAAGSTDVLRVLLDTCATRIDLSEVPHAHGTFLLWEACANTRVDTARFLLDDGPRFTHAHPAIGDIHSINQSGQTALLTTAKSFMGPGLLWWDDTTHDMRERLARNEILMDMLLDRGASAQDRMIEYRHGDPEPAVSSNMTTKEVVTATVLSLAISRASPRLVKRLIGGGADVHITIRSRMFDPLRAFDNRETSEGITPLHIGSYFLNVEGVQALLDRRNNSDVLDMVSCRDNHGCLPLHWAIGGSSAREESYMVSGEDIALQRICIFKLLLAPDPNTINARDNKGETVLVFATKNYGPSYSTHFDTLKFLCANGADAGARDNQGRNALHWLGHPRGDGEPIDTKIIDLFLAHGAKIGDTDQDGNTALHLIASCISQPEAIKFLINQGADPSTRNLKGDIPLHKAANPHGHLDYRKREEDYINAMEETVRVLEEAGGDPNAMDLPNSAGKTPRQLCDEFKRCWEGRARQRLEWKTWVKSGAGRGSRRGLGNEL